MSVGSGGRQTAALFPAAFGTLFLNASPFGISFGISVCGSLPRAATSEKWLFCPAAALTIGRMVPGSRAWRHCAAALASVILLAAAASQPDAAERPAAGTTTGAAASLSHRKFALQPGDVVAFLGGTDVAAAQQSGHLETLLLASHPTLGLRFRNFGWEGDTVYAQPRDIGFPSLEALLKREQVTVVIFQFGRTEALDGRAAVPQFVGAYGKLLDRCAVQTPRLVLVTPPPFEHAAPPLPDLGPRNAELGAYVEAIQILGRQRRLPVVDLHGELLGALPRQPKLTSDGLQLTTQGQARVAEAFARLIGASRGAGANDGTTGANGAWADAKLEALRQLVLQKNRLWFDYWRPQNWAFLGGDRTTQPSSHDHRDPKIRWFPSEMEKFRPLLEAKEGAISAANR